MNAELKATTDTSLTETTWWCVNAMERQMAKAHTRNIFNKFQKELPKSFRDFYFRALGSLVVLSFPQLVSFSSVFSKPLSETLRRSSDGRIPI
jgi:hypothetical protein